MTSSLAYRTATGYEWLMFALYGRHYPARSRAVSDLIPDGSSVLDLCCGPGTLYRRHLRDRGVAYTGIDINPRFVDRVRRLGGQGHVLDLRSGGDLPGADCVVLQASLYHFLPDPAPLIDRILKAAGRRAIIAEPIRNLADGPNPILRALARRQADPGTGSQPLRFDEATLDRTLGAAATRSFLIPGGREKVYVIDVGDGAGEEAPP